MDAKLFGLLVTLSFTSAVLQDYWCKTTTNNLGSCFIGSNCPAGYSPHMEARGFLGCYEDTQSSVYTCCVKDGVSIVPPTQAVSQDCGKLGKTARIIGSGVRSVGRCEYPWVVSIRSRLPNSAALTFQNTEYFCSGVLIDNNWVLTTAYCAFAAGQSPTTSNNVVDNLFVVANEHNVTSVDGSEQFSTISKAIIHPEFLLQNGGVVFFGGDKDQLNAANFALLKLTTPVMYNQCVSRVCLGNDLNLDNTCGGAECYVAGWGIRDSAESQIPYEAAVDVFSGAASQAIQRYMGNNPFTLQKYTLSAAGKVNGTRPCSGDNGNMVVCNQNGRFVLRGVVSQTSFNCDDDRPFIIADVNAVQSWITTTIANN